PGQDPVVLLGDMGRRLGLPDSESGFTTVAQGRDKLSRRFTCRRDSHRVWASSSKSTVCVIQKRTNRSATKISTQNREITLVSHSTIKTPAMTSMAPAAHVYRYFRGGFGTPGFFWRR